MNVPFLDPVGANISSASSVGRAPLFLAGRAKEVLRNSRKEVFPDERAPMMRILVGVISRSLFVKGRLT
jgi:hypothetical protein